MSSELQTAFLSYCREDQEFALKLAADLKGAGASVWIDQLDIEPGSTWDRSIEYALSNCPRMLVLLSPAAVRSENVQNEIARALRKQKTVIPAMYVTCEVPLLLERIQYVDLGTDYARGLNTLVRVLDASSPQTVVQESLQVGQRTSAPGNEAEIATRGQNGTAEKPHLDFQAQSRRPRLSTGTLAVAIGVIALAVFLWWMFSGKHNSEPEASRSQPLTAAQAPTQPPSGPAGTQPAATQPSDASIARGQRGSGSKQAKESGAGPKQEKAEITTEGQSKANKSGGDETAAAQAFAESAAKMFDAGNCSGLYEAFDQSARTMTKDQWSQLCSTALEKRGSLVSRSLASATKSMGYYRFIFNTKTTQGKVYEDVGVTDRSGSWRLISFYVEPNL